MDKLIMIAIVDYGAGNLRSVTNAIAKLGYQSRIITKPGEVLDARAIILPGVGATGDTMESLKMLGMVEPICQFITEGRPFFGICIGLQILFTGTEEGGWHECLGLFPGRVRKLPGGLKTPHMGWNQVRQFLTWCLKVYQMKPTSTLFIAITSTQTTNRWWLVRLTMVLPCAVSLLEEI